MVFITDHLDIFLPLLLLGLPFLLKIMVDRKVEAPNVIRAMCELPIDMILLAISFLIAIVISHERNRNEGLLFIFGFFILSMVVVFMARRSITFFEKGKFVSSGVIFFFNFLITLTCLIGAISLLIKPLSNKTAKNEKNKIIVNGIK